MTQSDLKNQKFKTKIFFLEHHISRIGAGREKSVN